jgi:hypothetical protein
VTVGVRVGVSVGVRVGVTVGVLVRVGVIVGVCVGAGVLVRVGVSAGVLVLVGVGVYHSGSPQVGHGGRHPKGIPGFGPSGHQVSANVGRADISAPETPSPKISITNSTRNIRPRII